MPRKVVSQRPLASLASLNYQSTDRAKLPRAPRDP